MKITGSNVVPYQVDRVWDALLDPQVLVATIPGCERLETRTSIPGQEHTYDMTVTAGVAAVRGTYSGTCHLSDLAEHESLVMRLRGAGAPGTIDATVNVRFHEAEPGHTRVDYEADAVVGGMVGGVGQRMLSSVSKRMAGEFFTNVAAAIGQPVGAPPMAGAVAAPGAPPVAGAVYTAPARPGGISSRDDFVKGIVVGAGLVVLGVVLGSVFGRRR